MEELDLLKKAWKKDTHSLEQVSEVEKASNENIKLK